ncbi:MAG: c-type cytochrome [Gammaproteobacteria bacterium]|nr:c-type cytochrome [Gammaproteobacteria bacterium]
MNKILYATVLTSVFLIEMLTASNALAEPPKAFEGRKVFNTSCFLCHGVDGKGHGPLSEKLAVPAIDLTDNSRLSKKTDRDLFRIIQGTAPHGLVSKDMPQWGLSIPEPQIKTLIAYVRFLHRSRYPLIGDPEDGQVIYQRSCSVCHGKWGEGDGPLTKVMSMTPADHTNVTEMNKISNKKLVAIIAYGSTGKTPMPGWEGILSKSQIEAVTSYIRLLTVH